jgi:hypothetical protein
MGLRGREVEMGLRGKEVEMGLRDKDSRDRRLEGLRG